MSFSSQHVFYAIHQILALLASLAEIITDLAAKVTSIPPLRWHSMNITPNPLIRQRPQFFLEWSKIQ